MQSLRQGSRATASIVAPLRADGARCISRSAVAFAKKKEVDPSLPVAPKGPSSPYTLFVKDWFSKNRESVTDPSTGKISLTAVGQQMGTAWTELAESAKAEYNKQAKELKATYNKEYQTFLESLSPETIKAMEAATGKKLRIPGGARAAKLEMNKRSGNPGRPLTAFFEFMKDFREKDGGDYAGQDGRSKIIEQAKRGAEEWKKMSEEDKKEWKDKAAENKRKYDEWHKSQSA